MKRLIYLTPVLLLAMCAVYLSSRYFRQASQGWVVEPQTVKLDLTPNSTVPFSVVVRNYTDHPIRVIGSHCDCSCVVSELLPMEVPAHDRRIVGGKCGPRGFAR